MTDTGPLELHNEDRSNRRRRLDAIKPDTAAGAVATSSPPLADDAARIYMQIKELQKERDVAIAERNQGLARIEQFESRVTELLSELEGERARTAAAKAEAEDDRVKRAQLETVLIGIRNQADDALPTG